MRYPHRYHLFCDAAGAEWVRLLALAMGDGGAAELETCRTALSPAADPAAEPVAWCCSFAATEAQRVQLEALEGAGQIPAGVFWCRSDAKTKRVHATNHPQWADAVAAGPLTFDLHYTLEQLGLTFHRPPSES